MRACTIFTDSTVHFTQPTFVGCKSVQVIPLEVTVNDQPVSQTDGRPCSLPAQLRAGTRLRLQTPDTAQLVQLFTQEARQNNAILAIFHSSHLSPLVANAQQAAKEMLGRTPIQVVDSLSIGPGLGMIVQVAAEALAHGAQLTEAERIVRILLPHIYTVLCTPNLSYLQNSGFVDHAQATVGEMLNLQPIFAIEEGHLSTLEKSRNHRQVLDFFVEYLDEFEELKHIALLLGTSANSTECRTLRDHAQSAFARTSFTEHTINLSLAALFGPGTTGLFLLDNSLPHRK